MGFFQTDGSHDEGKDFNCGSVALFVGTWIVGVNTVAVGDRSENVVED